MIVSNNTAQQNVYTQQTNTKKSESTNFEEALKSEKADNTSEVHNEKNKKVDRMSFEFIKNIDRNKIEQIYSDLDEEKRHKIYTLNSIANFSENDIFNKVLFNNAKDMSSKEAMGYLMMNDSTIKKYKETGDGHWFNIDSSMFEKDTSGKLKMYDMALTKEERKLSHTEAFDFLINMVNSAKKGQSNYEGELKELYKQSFIQFSALLDDYNQEIKTNLLGEKKYV